MELAEQVRLQVSNMLGRAGALTHNDLNDVVRLLAKYRSLLIQNTLLAECGAQIVSGPFHGMQFVSSSSEGCHVAKLLGCYERELHPWVESVIASNYEAIINIGCADGYYAVGFARRCPATQVFAFDINPAAQDACRELANQNGVSDRFHVGGIFSPKSFKDFIGRRTLLMIDIEGNELDLLEAHPASALSGFDLIVECHDCFQPMISERLLHHFAATHDLKLVKNELLATELPPFFEKLGHLDQLLATWEWRMGATPWMVAASRDWPENAFSLATSKDNASCVPQ